MEASRFERRPSADNVDGQLEAPIVALRQAALARRSLRNRDEPHHHTEPSRYIEEERPPSPQEDIEETDVPAQTVRLNRLPMPSDKFDKPYVDFEEAKEKHPEVFSAEFDFRAKGNDRPALRSMVTMFTDYALQKRVDEVLAGENTPRNYTPGLTGSSNSDFINKSLRYRVLQPEEEIVLSKNIKLGVAAFNIMGKNNDFSDPVLVGLAREGAYSYQAFFHANLRLPTEYFKKSAQDYPHIQSGALYVHALIGIHNAIEKFDERKGFKFSTHAMFWIRHHVQRGVAEGRMIHVPNDVHILLQGVNRVRAEIIQTSGSQDEAELLEEMTGSSIREISYLERVASTSMPSLNFKPNPDAEYEFGDLIPAPDTEKLEEDAEHSRKLFGKLLENAGIDKIDKLLLSFRHGVFLDELVGMEVGNEGLKYEDAFYELPGNYDRPPTFEDVAKATGINTKFVRKSIESTLERIHDANSSEDLN